MDDPLVIHPLDAGRLADHLHFFDHDAFADNPRWASCYCNFLHADHDARDWNSRDAAENRAAIIPLVEQRRYRGYLAYRGGKPIGWCHAGPKALTPALLDGPADADPRIGAIGCFVVAKPWRGQGVARALLARALADFAAQGFAWAEAFPQREAAGEAANHWGPLAMYLAAGFEIVDERPDGGLTVRKRLGEAGS